MKRINYLVAIGAFSFLVLGLPAIASAQYGGQYDPNGRNGGYDNGQYGNYGNYGNLRSTIRDLKNRSKELKKHLDRDLDRSRYDGTRREDQLNDLARRFKDAVSRLSESNNGRRDNEVQRVLDLGSQLDRSLSRTRLDYHIQEMWSGIRYDLQVLGNAYGYNNNNRNNRNNRYPQTGNGGYNKPSWWPF